jgi:hypothetical protein
VAFSAWDPTHPHHPENLPEISPFQHTTFLYPDSDSRQDKILKSSIKLCYSYCISENAPPRSLFHAFLELGSPFVDSHAPDVSGDDQARACSRIRILTAAIFGSLSSSSPSSPAILPRSLATTVLRLVIRASSCQLPDAETRVSFGTEAPCPPSLFETANLPAFLQLSPKVRMHFPSVVIHYDFSASSGASAISGCGRGFDGFLGIAPAA